MNAESGLIDVWWLGLDEAGTYDLDAISPAERERALAMHHPRDSARRMAASGLVRGILARYDARPAVALPISRDERGRPLLDGSNLRFSISHAGPLGAVAIGHERALGIDLEPMSAAQLIAEVAQAYLPAARIRAIPSDTGPDQDCAWVALWTEVEARAKMTGEGIGRLSPTECEALLALPAIVKRLVPQAGFLATLAYEGPRARIRIKGFPTDAYAL